MKKSFALIFWRFTASYAYHRQTYGASPGKLQNQGGGRLNQGGDLQIQGGGHVIEGCRPNQDAARLITGETAGLFSIKHHNFVLFTFFLLIKIFDLLNQVS